jgi:hypothetical protein
MRLYITPALDAQLVALMERYRAKYRANPDQRIALANQLHAEFWQLKPDWGDINPRKDCTGQWWNIESKLMGLVFRPIYKSKSRRA